ncbi:MAG: HAD domain-containing protein [Burkholderiaceae bacterium]
MILFLDFDGVLHPEPCYQVEALLCHLPKFESLLRDFPAVDIVISSTWRDKRTLEELQALFSPDIGKRIVGVTPYWQDHPDLMDVIGNYQRHIEIEAWRRVSGRIYEEWFALDDRAYLFKPFLQNLVRCDPATGITDAIEIELRRRLS